MAPYYPKEYYSGNRLQDRSSTYGNASQYNVPNTSLGNYRYLPSSTAVPSSESYHSSTHDSAFPGSNTSYSVNNTREISSTNCANRSISSGPQYRSNQTSDPTYYAPSSTTHGNGVDYNSYGSSSAAQSVQARYSHPVQTQNSYASQGQHSHLSQASSNSGGKPRNTTLTGPQQRAQATSGHNAETSVVSEGAQRLGPHGQFYGARDDPRNTISQVSTTATQPPSNSFPTASSASKHDGGNRYSTSDTSSSMTVNPTQVYNSQHEHQRAASQRVEAERARQAKETLQATSRDQTSPQQAPSQSETPGIVNSKTKKTSRKAAKPRRSTQKDSADAADAAAAMTLMHSANGTVDPDLEKQMKEMFRKMREFNQRDPELLAKLWQKEREDHLASEAAKETYAASGTEPSKEKPAKRTQVAKQHKASASTTYGDQPVPNPKATTSPKKRSSITESGMPATAFASVPAPKAAATSLPSSRPEKAISSTTAKANNRTIWPADKKATIAAAAARMILERPDNLGKIITDAEISNILDSNPSYVQFCEQIEGRGFGLDRIKFANALVAAVPGVNKRGTTNNGSAANAISTTPATVTPAGTVTSEPVNAAVVTAEAEKGLLSGAKMLAAPKKSPGTAKRTSLGSKAKSPSQHPIATGTSTQVAADKADIQELDAIRRFNESGQVGVTMTPGGTSQSNDSKKAAKGSSKPKRSISPISVPQTKENLARKRHFSDLVDLSLLSESEEDYIPPPKRFEDDTQSHDSHLGDAGILNHVLTPPHTDKESAPVSAAIKGPRPLENSMKQPSFSIASAQELVRPQAQKMAMTDDENKSRSAPPQALNYAGVQLPPVPPSHPARVTQLARPLDKYKALRRSMYDPRTIARDVLLACGRHPEMGALNRHLETLKIAFRSTLSDGADLATFRWDLVDPGGPPVGSGAEPVTIEDDVMDGAEADDEDDDVDSVLGQSFAMSPSVAVGVAGSGSNNTVAAGSHRRVGRPLKASQHSKSVNIVGLAAGLAQHPPRPPPTQQSLTQGKNSGATTYAALRAAQESEGGPSSVKRRGRPVGWRKWMQQTPSDTPAKRSGAVRKDPPAPEPEYQVYRCEWQACTAELHNLNTLRRHIRKLHLKRAQDDSFPCLWADCSRSAAQDHIGASESHSGLRRHHFKAEQECWSHVEKKHISPVAWRLGDGPSDGVSDHYDTDPGSQSYLSDRQGRRVTPTVQMPDDSRDEPARKKKSGEERAREEQARWEKKKRAIGAGIDKGGGTLVTPERRLALIDDDETAMIVDED